MNTLNKNTKVCDVDFLANFFNTRFTGKTKIMKKMIINIHEEEQRTLPVNYIVRIVGKKSKRNPLENRFINNLLEEDIYQPIKKKRKLE